MVDAALEQNPLYRVLQAVRRVTEQGPLEFAGTKLFMDDEDVKKCRLRVFIAHTRSYVQELGWDSFYQSAQMAPVELLEAAGESIGAELPHNGRRGNREWKHYWFPLLNFLGEQYDAKANELPDKFDSCAYCFKPCNLKPCEGVKGGSACPFGTAKGGKWVHHCCMDKYSALADEVGGRRCRNCFSASCLKEAKKLLSSDVTNNEEEGRVKLIKWVTRVNNSSIDFKRGDGETAAAHTKRLLQALQDSLDERPPNNIAYYTGEEKSAQQASKDMKQAAKFRSAIAGPLKAWLEINPPMLPYGGKGGGKGGGGNGGGGKGGSKGKGGGSAAGDEGGGEGGGESAGKGTGKGGSEGGGEGGGEGGEGSGKGKGKGGGATVENLPVEEPEGTVVQARNDAIKRFRQEYGPILSKGKDR